MARIAGASAATTLRVRVAASALLGCMPIAVIALMLPRWLGAPAPHPLVPLVLFAAMMALVVATVAEAHPFPRFGPANHLTMVRGMLLALAAGAIAAPQSAAMAWALVASTAVFALLDGVDGVLARRSGMASAFGARFDMETDACFILVLSVLVWRYDKAGVWVLASGLMRYAFVAAGFVFRWIARPLRSTRRGKTTAVLQFVGLAVALAPVVPVRVSTAIAAATVAVLTWSFAVDVRFLWRTRDRA